MSNLKKIFADDDPMNITTQFYFNWPIVLEIKMWKIY